MKSILFIISFFILISCGSNSTRKGSISVNTDTAATQNKNASSTKSACEEFLNDYENWVDEVIKIYKIAEENPMDIRNTQQIMEATQKMADWSEKWTKLYECAKNDKYSKRMDELQEKLNMEE